VLLASPSSMASGASPPAVRAAGPAACSSRSACRALAGESRKRSYKGSYRTSKTFGTLDVRFRQREVALLIACRATQQTLGLVPFGRSRGRRCLRDGENAGKKLRRGRRELPEAPDGPGQSAMRLNSQRVGRRSISTCFSFCEMRTDHPSNPSPGRVGGTCRQAHPNPLMPYRRCEELTRTRPVDSGTSARGAGGAANAPCPWTGLEFFDKSELNTDRQETGQGQFSQ
jgi:hypothetical protein